MDFIKYIPILNECVLIVLVPYFKSYLPILGYSIFVISNSNPLSFSFNTASEKEKEWLPTNVDHFIKASKISLM